VEFLLFYSILQEFHDAIDPLHPILCKQSHHSTSSLLRDAFCAKAQAKRKADISMSDSDITLYKQLKNRLKHIVHGAKLVYIKELLKGSSLYWSVVERC